MNETYTSSRTADEFLSLLSLLEPKTDKIDTTGDLDLLTEISAFGNLIDHKTQSCLEGSAIMELPLLYDVEVGDHPMKAVCLDNSTEDTIPTLADIEGEELSVDLQALIANVPNFEGEQLFPDLFSYNKNSEGTNKLTLDTDIVKSALATNTDLDTPEANSRVPPMPSLPLQENSTGSAYWNTVTIKQEDLSRATTPVVVEAAEPGVPTTVTEVAAPSSSRKSGGGKTPRRKAIPKDSEDYRQRRDRNNVAVRKSRDKAKQQQQETQKKVKSLSDENERLTKKCELLEKELNVLKGLFTNVGAVLPPELQCLKLG